MLQRIIVPRAVASSKSASTIFINRSFFSNYYLGTLLSQQVTKIQGDLGTHMSYQNRNRLRRSWERSAELAQASSLEYTRKALLNPLLDLLSFDDLRKIVPAAFHLAEGETLPPGYYIYTPTGSQAELELPTSETEAEPQEPELFAFGNDEEESEQEEHDGEMDSSPDQADSSAPQADMEKRPGVLFSLLPWGQDFDQTFPARIRRHDTPARLMERLLADGPLHWGLLFNGQRLRLMKSAVISGRQQYFEVDLDALCENGEEQDFNIFWMLFRAQAFQPGPAGLCLLDVVDEESRKHAMGVSTALKFSVYGAVETLMSSLVERATELTHQSVSPEDATGRELQQTAQHALENLKQLYEESLIYLYRLLFVFYAESRQLLPIAQPIYRDSYSLEPLRDEIEQPGDYLPSRYRLWESLQALFRLIRNGCNAGQLIVPSYNGSLFKPDSTALVNALRISDKALKEILSHLSQTRETKGRSRERIDYNDLGVEQLGSVYEGLLEFEPRIARELMVEVNYKNTRVVIPARNNQREGEQTPLYTVTRAFAPGEFYLGRGAGRKVSGSYYTPQPLVDFLVRRTLEPLIKDRSAAEILQLKVVDPAMGSGAFLVGACLYLAREYARALKAEDQATARALREAAELAEKGEAPASAGQAASELATGTPGTVSEQPAVTSAISPTIQTDENAPLFSWQANEDEPADDEQPEQLDTDLPVTSTELSEEETLPYRRLIAEHCLYGVDLNPMAVELAKVSLWLITLAGDKPLTFLDANLRCGNSLIGAPLIPYHAPSGLEYFAERIHPAALKRLAKTYGEKLATAPSSPPRANPAQPELIHQGLLPATIAPLMDLRRWIAETPSDTVDQVHHKEDFMHDLEKSPARRTNKQIGDLWVASWFWHQPTAPAKKDSDQEKGQKSRGRKASQSKNSQEGKSPSLFSEITAEAEAAQQSTEVETTDISAQNTRPVLSGQVYAELVSYFKGQRDLEPYMVPFLAEIKHITEEVRPFHWELEFPEVFLNDNETRKEQAGFDAILGNPPWDAVKPNSREFFSAYDPGFRELERALADERQTKLCEDIETNEKWNEYVQEIGLQLEYFRQSEMYPYQSVEVDGKLTGGDMNTYKIFLEQSKRLLSNQGSASMIVKAGIYKDKGSTGIRRLLFLQGLCKFIHAFSNEKWVFPSVHHAERFALVGFANSSSQTTLQVSFAITTKEAVNPGDLADYLTDPHKIMSIPQNLIARLSRDTLSIMEFRSQRDIDIISKIYEKRPLLGEKLKDAWFATFTNEFHLTKDRPFFNQKGEGWILYEGKTIHQYTPFFGDHSYWVEPKVGRKELARKEIKRVEAKLDPLVLKRFPELSKLSRQARILAFLKENGRGPLTEQDVRIDVESPRLAFRDVASNTNERSMIATILPQNVFLGNTINYISPWLFNADKAATNLNALRDCYTPALPLALIAYTCGVFNSFVIDYIVFLKVTNHVNIFLAYQLPVPRLTAANPYVRAIAHRVARLVCVGTEFDDLRRELLGSISASVLPFEEREARQQVQNEIDALVAHLYGLSAEDLAHILYAPYTFPLVRQEIKDGVMSEFARVEDMLREE